jgi:hypothetical protein
MDITDQDVPFNLLNVGVGSTEYIATIRPSNIDVVPNIFRGYKDNDAIQFQVASQPNMGTIYEPISVGLVNGALTTVSTYVPNSHYLDYDFQYDQTQVNFVGGIRTGMFYSNQGRWQFKFTPPIVKLSNYRMRFKVRTSWARYVPLNDPT